MNQLALAVAAFHSAITVRPVVRRLAGNRDTIRGA